MWVLFGCDTNLLFGNRRKCWEEMRLGEGSGLGFLSNGSHGVSQEKYGDFLSGFLQE